MFNHFAVTATDYVKLSHDGPTVLGANITFRADLYTEQSGWFADKKYKYSWFDSLKNTYTVRKIMMYHWKIIMYHLSYIFDIVTKLLFETLSFQINLSYL